MGMETIKPEEGVNQEKPNEHLEAHNQEFRVLYDFVNEIDKTFEERGGFTFDRQGFLGELTDVQRQVLKHQYPDGVVEKETQRDVRISDLDRQWAMGGPNGYEQFLVALDLFHHLKSKRLVAEEDRELLFRSW